MDKERYDEVVKDLSNLRTDCEKVLAYLPELSKQLKAVYLAPDKEQEEKLAKNFDKNINKLEDTLIILRFF